MSHNTNKILAPSLNIALWELLTTGGSLFLSLSIVNENELINVWHLLLGFCVSLSVVKGAPLGTQAKNRS